MNPSKFKIIYSTLLPFASIYSPKFPPYQKTNKKLQDLRNFDRRICWLVFSIKNSVCLSKIKEQLGLYISTSFS